MVSASIFALHIGVFFYLLLQRKKKPWSEVLLSLAFFVIIFSVGWTLSTALARMMFPPEGLAAWLDDDAISLILVTIGELFFYYVFFNVSASEKNKKTTDGGNAAPPAM
jgi:TRAP-type C4-dicarboxylate transport system permease small subunit